MRQPDVDTAREFWLPTAEQAAELEGSNARPRAARETELHLDALDEEGLVLRFDKRKQEEDYLSKSKHVSGDFSRWIIRFEDQVKVCETIGVVLTEEAKIFYFMNNLNGQSRLTTWSSVQGCYFRDIRRDQAEDHRGVRPEYPEKTSDRAQGNRGRGRQAPLRGELQG